MLLVFGREVDEDGHLVLQADRYDYMPTRCSTNRSGVRRAATFTLCSVMIRMLTHKLLIWRAFEIDAPTEDDKTRRERRLG